MTRPAGLAPGGASGARTLLRLAPARAGGRGPRRRAGPGRAVRDAGPSRLPDRVRARALDVRAAPGALGTGAAVRSARADKMAAMGLAGVADQAAIDVFDKGARQARGAPRRPRGRQRRGPGPQPARSHRPARPGRVRSPGVEPPPPPKPLQTHHPRATTSASATPRSATRADSPWPTESPSPRGDGSTASTAPRNTQRPHPGPPGRITPQWARDAGEVARAPRPGHDTDPITPADRTRARRPPGADRRTGADPSPPAASAKPAITRNGRRPHRRHRAPGPPRPGRAPNHRDPRHHHHHPRPRPRPAS